MCSRVKRRVPARAGRGPGCPWDLHRELRRTSAAMTIVGPVSRAGSLPAIRTACGEGRNGLSCQGAHLLSEPSMPLSYAYTAIANHVVPIAAEPLLQPALDR